MKRRWKMPEQKAGGSDEAAIRKQWDEDYRAGRLRRSPEDIARSLALPRASYPWHTVMRTSAPCAVCGDFLYRSEAGHVWGERGRYGWNARFCRACDAWCLPPEEREGPLPRPDHPSEVLLADAPLDPLSIVIGKPEEPVETWFPGVQVAFAVPGREGDQGLARVFLPFWDGDELIHEWVDAEITLGRPGKPNDFLSSRLHLRPQRAAL